MPLRWAMPIAAALLLVGMAEARAQNNPTAALQSACYQKFLELRAETEKRFGVAKTALGRKASPAELCRVLKSLTDAENKMVKYVEEQGIWCGFPPEALPSLKANHVQSQDFRKQACTAAAQPQPARPAAPSLSDALSPPVADESNTRTGRGTLDSLGGNPLAR